VSLSHATAILRCMAYFENAPKSRYLTFGTAYWVSGFYPCISIGLAHSETRILTQQRFNVDLLIELVEKYEITKMMLPPTALNELLQREKSWNFSSLKSLICSGSVVSTSLRQRFLAKFPTIKFCISYGMTEYGVVRPIGDHNETSVGKTLVGNVEVKIVDDDENRLGAGEIGEIRVRNSIKFLGYYGNSEATEKALDKEGFLMSGDIGYFDEDRQLYIVNRKKDIFKYKGFQYNPSEIEAVIELIEGVNNVSVVGVLNDSDDIPTAVVVKQKEYENILTEEVIKKFVESKLSINKHLHGGVIFVDEIPMTASGKIQRKKVLEMISERYKNLTKKRLTGF
jgi:4-coumarate--CoA ligase